MFSIAAINDTDSCGQWEPLAPTKEAHVGNNASDGHLLRLRFLTLKNLATVFLEQGPPHYKNALQCYIQAVEIDANDSVVWNQLGTLSCTMGLLSTSLWAFEQGLLCSPNNWNCMEKLLEILLAIGDEVACLSVADLILRHWPSHSRARRVKKTIENAESVPFAPRGIDKLEPKHIRLKFPDKRKAQYGESDENISSKRHQKSLELNLAGATWVALADSVLSIFLPGTRKDSEPGFIQNGALNEKSDDRHSDSRLDEGCLGLQTHEKIGKYTNVKVDICLSSSSEMAMDS